MNLSDRIQLAEKAAFGTKLHVLVAHSQQLRDEAAQIDEVIEQELTPFINKLLGPDCGRKGSKWSFSGVDDYQVKLTHNCIFDCGYDQDQKYDKTIVLNNLLNL